MTKLLATRGEARLSRKRHALAYYELHRLAGSRVRGGDRVRFQTTEFVNDGPLTQPKPSDAF